MAGRTATQSLSVRLSNPLRLVADFALLIFGLFIFALANVFSLHCNLGASSWTVFHDGISKHTPLSIGQAAQVVGLVMVVVSWVAGVRPGLGTVANMFLVGFFMDRILDLGVVPVAGPYAQRIAWLLLAVVILGIASALYIKAGFGAGPRDSFMLAVMSRTGLRVGKVRWGMELSVVGFGILLGGDFGIGTILFALMVAPSVDFFFRRLDVQVTRPVEPAPVAAAD